jgi:hypothetical protein
MDILKAKDIAKETAKLNNSFSQVMNLAIQLKEENDALKTKNDNTSGWVTRRGDEVRKLKSQNAELKRQRDEALGKQPLFEKNIAEANELSVEDLKPALILALCQRDVALRSVKKIHLISDLIDTWDGNTQENWNNGPASIDVVRHIKDVILKTKEAV